ncbi:MAG: Uma2 family endonuclease [Polyangiaceae bacterium]
MKAALARTWTAEEYLAWEAEQPIRHEYSGGQVFAMAGASAEHNQIVANVLGELRSALREKPCRVFASDMRLKIPETGIYTYPDAAVVCGQPMYEDEKRLTLLNPTVLVEVLSDSTESYDRGKKFQAYRSVPSLTDYLLVAQDTVWIEHYVRTADSGWILHDTLPGGVVRLASCGVELRADEIYWKVLGGDGSSGPVGARQ